METKIACRSPCSYRSLTIAPGLFSEVNGSSESRFSLTDLWNSCICAEKCINLLREGFYKFQQSDRVDKSDGVGVPGNFREVVRPMIEAALLAQPDDIIGFAADYFEEQLKQNENEWCGSGEMNIHGSPVQHKQTQRDENRSPESGNKSHKAIDFEMNVENNPDVSTVSLENEFNAKPADKVLNTAATETGPPCSIPNTAFSEQATKIEITEQQHISVLTDKTRVVEYNRYPRSKQEINFSEVSETTVVSKENQCENLRDNIVHNLKVQSVTESDRVTVNQKLIDNEHLACFDESSIVLNRASENKPENVADNLPNDEKESEEIVKETGSYAFCSPEAEKFLTCWSKKSLSDHLREVEDAQVKVIEESSKIPDADKTAEAENTADDKTADFQQSECTLGKREVEGFYDIPVEKQRSNNNNVSSFKDFPLLVPNDFSAAKNEDRCSMEVSETLDKLLNQVAFPDSGESKSCESSEIKLDGINHVEAFYYLPIPDISEHEQRPAIIPLMEKISTDGRKSCSGVDGSAGERLSPLRKAQRIGSDSVVSWDTCHAQRYRDWVNRNRNLRYTNPKFQAVSRYDLRSNQASNSDTCFGKNVPCDLPDCSGKWNYCGAQPRVPCANNRKQRNNETFSDSFRTDLLLNQQFLGKEKKHSLPKPIDDCRVKDEFRSKVSSSGKIVKQRAGKIFSSPPSSESISDKAENSNFLLECSGSSTVSRTILSSKGKSDIMCGVITMEGDIKAASAPWRIKRDGKNGCLEKKANLPEKRDYEKFIKADETDRELTQSNYRDVTDETWKIHPVVLSEEQSKNSKEQEFSPSVLNLELRDINNNTIFVDPSQERLDLQWERMESNEIFLQSLTAQELEGNALDRSKDGTNIVWDNMQEPSANDCAKVSDSYFNIESGDYDDDYVIIEDMMNQKDSASKRSSMSGRSSSDERGDIDSADSGEKINTLDSSSAKNFSKDVDSQEKMFVGEGGDMPATGAAKYANDHENPDQQKHGKYFHKNGSQVSKRSSDSALNLKTPSIFDWIEHRKEGQGFSKKDFLEIPTHEKTLLGAQLELTLVKLLKNDSDGPNRDSSLGEFENINGYHSEIPGKTTVDDVLEKSQDMSLRREDTGKKNSCAIETTNDYVRRPYQTNADVNEAAERKDSEFEKCEANRSASDDGDEQKIIPKWPFRDVFKPRNVNERRQMKSVRFSSQETPQKDTCSSESSTLELFLLETETDTGNSTTVEVEESTSIFKYSELSSIEQVEEAKTNEEGILNKKQGEEKKNFVGELQNQNGSNVDQNRSDSPSYETPSQNDRENNRDSKVTTSPGVILNAIGQDELTRFQNDRWAGFIHMMNHNEEDESDDLSDTQDSNSGRDQDAND